MLLRVLAAVLALLLCGPGAARADEVGTTLPEDFPVITDTSLGQPVLGFGAKGPVRRTPVVFLHGNNDTPFKTTCGALGHVHDFAQYLHDRGYALSELWGLGYQGDQCDLVTSPPNRSAEPHTTLANVPDVRAFVRAVLAYTGARQVDIVGHSLGTTVAREWMRQDRAYDVVRTLVAVDGPSHGIINCSPSPQNAYAAPAAGGFTPDSAVCQEYGSDHTPLLSALNAGDETPGPTAYLALVNADTSFVYFDRQDGAFPPAPAQDREGQPHDFSRSARLEGAVNVELTGQGAYDESAQSAHLGIVNSPESWGIAYAVLSDPARAGAPAGAPGAGPGSPSPSPSPSASSRVRVPPRVTVRVRRAGRRLVTRGRVVPPAGVACGADGSVVVRVGAGRRTVSARSAPVGPGCRFRSAVRFRHGVPRRARVVVRFSGSSTLTPARARVSASRRRGRG